MILKLKRMRLQFGARNSDLSSRFDTYTGHPAYYPCHALVVYIRRWLRDVPTSGALLPPGSTADDDEVPDDTEVFAVYEPGTALLVPVLAHLKGAAPSVRLTTSVQLDALAEYLTTGFVPVVARCADIAEATVTACEDDNA